MENENALPWRKLAYNPIVHKARGYAFVRDAHGFVSIHVQPVYERVCHRLRHAAAARRVHVFHERYANVKCSSHFGNQTVAIAHVHILQPPHFLPQYA
eukprot:2917466-Rhodomonas_salina.2